MHETLRGMDLNGLLFTSKMNKRTAGNLEKFKIMGKVIASILI